MGDKNLNSTLPSDGGGDGNGMTCEKCWDHIDKILRTPKLQLVLEGMTKNRCRKNDLWVDNCEKRRGGYYNPDIGIVICHNHMESYEDVERVLLHELIHVYDLCRFPNMNWKNIHSRACTEIRAYRLCFHHAPEYVKYYATKSTMNHCSEAEAKSAVEVMWDTCYNDTAPFVGPDRINWGIPKANDSVDTK